MDEQRRFPARLFVSDLPLHSLTGRNAELHSKNKTLKVGGDAMKENVLNGEIVKIKNENQRNHLEN